MLEEAISKARAKLESEVTAIEERKDLTDDQKVERIIVLFSTGCAAIAVQPIPFADFFILTPLQAYMGSRISAIRHKRISESDASKIIKEMMGVVGLGLIAQQIGIAAAKIFFPIFGGVATIPVVFGLTYAIGQVMDAYFKHKATGRTLSDEDIKKIFEDALKRGKTEGKLRQDDIRNDGQD